MSKIHENLEKSQKSIFETSVYSASGHSTGAPWSLRRPLEHSLACLDPLLPLRRALNFEEVGAVVSKNHEILENLKTIFLQIHNFFRVPLFGKRRLKSPTALRGSF